VKLLKLHEGDTIVEVLIAMAAVGLVLGGAYTSANRSLNSTRAAQERGEALKVAEGQFEGLNALAIKGSPVNIFDTLNPVFCLDSDLQPHYFKNSYDPSKISLAATDFSLYPSECQQQARYYVSITYSKNPNPPNLDEDHFNVLVRWDRVNGGRDEINAVYRIHPPE
jgi:type II secretory pathway pseudopilin PulG